MREYITSALLITYTPPLLIMSHKVWVGIEIQCTTLKFFLVYLESVALSDFKYANYKLLLLSPTELFNKTE